jgi:predicted Rossmann-fold nucleotide-binding protein
VVLVGKDYWQPLVDFMRQRLLAEHTIDAADADRMIMTDSPAEVVDSVTDVAMKRFGLTYGPRARRRWFLWE